MQQRLCEGTICCVSHSMWVAHLKVEEDLTQKHRQEVLDYVDKMYTDGELDISVVNYLHEQECKAARFYLLPKIRE